MGTRRERYKGISYLLLVHITGNIFTLSSVWMPVQSNRKTKAILAMFTSGWGK
ncbi:hypothetical protein [Halalkalibacter sp. APA_J-10(15)]|nr:hypothetical protein [Halalkalibacter sp. APA_J-10(15)]